MSALNANLRLFKSLISKLISTQSAIKASSKML